MNFDNACKLYAEMINGEWLIKIYGNKTFSFSVYVEDRFEHYYCKETVSAMMRRYLVATKKAATNTLDEAGEVIEKYLLDFVTTLEDEFGHECSGCSIQYGDGEWSGDVQIDETPYPYYVYFTAGTPNEVFPALLQRLK